MLSAFAYTGAIQTYTVPLTGIYDITAAGAEGGEAWAHGLSAGGLGAVLSGEVMLTAGTTLDVVVGGMGGYGRREWRRVAAAVSCTSPAQSEPLVAAGGGGGA